MSNLCSKPIPPMTRADIERFWSYVERTAEGECWQWRGSKQSDGYSTISIGSRTCKAYRVVYALTYGQIPESYTLDHLCRNRACVNPEHLQVVTLRVNVWRGYGRFWATEAAGIVDAISRYDATDDLIPLGAASDLLRLNKRRVCGLIQTGELSCYTKTKVNRFVPRSSLVEFVRSRAAADAAKVSLNDLFPLEILESRPAPLRTDRRIPLPTPEQEEQFWACLPLRESGQCWIWKGAVNGDKPSMYLDRVSYPATRVMWRMKYGSIPSGTRLTHCAKSKLCCNPEHVGIATRDAITWRHKGKNWKKDAPQILRSIVAAPTLGGFIALSEAAKLLGLDSTAVGSMVKRDEIPCTASTSGKRLYLHQRDLISFVIKRGMEDAGLSVTKAYVEELAQQSAKETTNA